MKLCKGIKIQHKTLGIILCKAYRVEQYLSFHTTYNKSFGIIRKALVQQF
jgi:hypothetical protein